MDGPLLVIDRDDARPLGQQLVDGLRRGILDGRLRAGDAVPSTRSLADELGVARSSVVAAYDQLAGEGYLELRQGAPTRVAPLVRAEERAQRAPVGIEERAQRASRDPHDPPEATALELRPGLPSTARLDERAWRAAWRAAAKHTVPGDIPPVFGSPRLRVEVADHLRHARGLSCSPDDVVVTAGTSDAVALLASALRVLVDGTPRVAVEHPGYPSARRVVQRRGALETVPVPVDADGIDVAALRGIRPAPHAVMVTPHHQYPLGGRLPVAAR
ncbi:PLP-dependent aminotransferase family protein, partial [Agromyces sp. CCNWLW208]